ncbi:MAG TPA: ABC transporter ATP-binding protein [Bacteroidales bacterium]|jgi:zinc transport system ATP-binding protein|nr:ABC transporter ATP-binding protein [Bacteroidales bacterium]MBP7874662.1 ABC transporter ATP-binding protein [Bacteroidales bacterium]MCZ2282839.1 ABC transporter ATP-binding protein [Bacteroidales bacterium]HPX34590.1 ABC transporter ATP-binding protein [Bacteroidales bacterium]HQB48768.1 ABC transporter ATP-binding protein [Bacteroidales bacterium]
MDKIIELQNVTAGYGEDIILRNVNIAIHRNDFIGVIGPNGGGKTTLVKVILGLIKPITGKVIYYDSMKEGKQQKIGYLPQNSDTDKVFPISVLDVVLSGLAQPNRLINRFLKAQKAKAREILESTGILHLADKNFGELSGGEMQRVFLCRAIVSDPELLILDEPNTFVDNKFESDLYHTLKKLNEHKAIIMVSHDVGTIAYYVKSIACVNRELHYHQSNIISQEQLDAYNCPIQIIAHGSVPHTILKEHNE